MGKYKNRAFEKGKYRRNSYWHNIVKKVGYSVEIILEDISWIEACYTEKYLIRYYGRVDLGTGILCNMSEGGDGVLDMSPETKAKIYTPERAAKLKANINYEYLRSPENLAKLNTPEARVKAVLNKDYSFMKTDEFKRTSRTPEAIAKRNANTDRSYCKTPEAIARLHTPEVIAKRIANTNRDYLKTPEFISKRVASTDYNDKGNKCKKPIIQNDLSGEYIREWDSAKDAGEALRIDRSDISKCCLNKKTSAGKFKWKYKNVNNLI